MTLHHFVTNGYQGAITRKQRELFRVPPRAKLELVSPARRTKKCLLSFALRSLKRAVSGLENTAPVPPGSRRYPFHSFLPSFRPSVPPVPATLPHTATAPPRAPADRAGLGPPRIRGPRAGTAPGRAPGAPRERGGPAAGLSPPVGPGRAGHRDRQDTGSRSAATTAAVANCFDVSKAVARPAPRALRLRGSGGPHPGGGPPRGGRGGARGRGRVSAPGGVSGMTVVGMCSLPNQPGVWGTEVCPESMRLGV